MLFQVGVENYGCGSKLVWAGEIHSHREYGPGCRFDCERGGGASEVEDEFLVEGWDSIKVHL
jgi:hypothetical protein